MAESIHPLLQPLDVEALRREFREAAPFPFIAIDGFLEPGFARELAGAYPSADEAERMGKTFRALNERGKTQVTDAGSFSDPVRRLNELLASPEWLSALSTITGIPKLLADDELVGGGMHVMRPGAHLDVHIDFNLIPNRQLHRRLNILIFLNEGWQPEWNGCLELWDRKVKHRHHSFMPELNRCVIFETSQKSFHGVSRVTTPEGVDRRSFAAYYYTREAPEGWDGRSHTTIFRARPDEQWKGMLMPAAKLANKARRPVRKLISLARGAGRRGGGA